MNKKITLIAGNCAIESEKTAMETALVLKTLTAEYSNIDYIFKGSYDKANRTSGQSPRGIGIDKGLEILRRIGSYGIKTLTDVHRVGDVKKVAESVDIVQIPAFLCRQTDLIEEVSKYASTINIKKGQFMAPEDMEYAIDKCYKWGYWKNKTTWVTERGTSFGYHNLVVDFRSFQIMSKFADKVIFDATHSQQVPSKGGKSGGSREFIESMIRGAIATRYVDGIFMETHPEPHKAISDKATQIPLINMEYFISMISKEWSKRGY